MNQFPLPMFLSRNPLGAYSGTYSLSTYLPKQNPEGDPACWWYWGNSELDTVLDTRQESLVKLAARIGNVEPGTSVNLSTGEVTRLEDAPRVTQGRA